MGAPLAVDRADDAPPTSSAGADIAAAAARGAAEFGCAATMIVLFVGAFSRSAETAEVAAAWLGLVLGGAGFAIAPAAWRRAETVSGKRLVLLLSGFLAALALVAPTVMANLGGRSGGEPLTAAIGLAIG